MRIIDWLEMVIENDRFLSSTRKVVFCLNLFKKYVHCHFSSFQELIKRVEMRVSVGKFVKS